MHHTAGSEYSFSGCLSVCTAAAKISYRQPGCLTPGQRWACSTQCSAQSQAVPLHDLELYAGSLPAPASTRTETRPSASLVAHSPVPCCLQRSYPAVPCSDVRTQPAPARPASCLSRPAPERCNGGSPTCCTRYVDQGGGKRKGAFALYLEPWHADVYDFLDLRKNHGKEEVRCMLCCCRRLEPYRCLTGREYVAQWCAAGAWGLDV